jgi:phosphocarrier protein
MSLPRDIALVRDLTIINKRGLHARAAARFVQTAERFDATVTVSRDGHSVGADSIMGLMMLAAATGTTIHLEASGKEAVVALDALEKLVGERFGEEE